MMHIMYYVHTSLSTSSVFLVFDRYQVETYMVI